MHYSFIIINSSQTKPNLKPIQSQHRSKHKIKMDYLNAETKTSIVVTMLKSSWKEDLMEDARTISNT